MKCFAVLTPTPFPTRFFVLFLEMAFLLVADTVPRGGPEDPLHPLESNVQLSDQTRRPRGKSWGGRETGARGEKPAEGDREGGEGKETAHFLGSPFLTTPLPSAVIDRPADHLFSPPPPPQPPPGQLRTTIRPPGLRGCYVTDGVSFKLNGTLLKCKYTSVSTLLFFTKPSQDLHNVSIMMYSSISGKYLVQ